MNDLALERAVLAGLCQFGSAMYYRISDLLVEDVFSSDSNRVLFKCLKKCFDGGADKLDWPSIFSAANELGYTQVNDEKEKAYIASLFQLHLIRDNIEPFSAKLYKLYIARLSTKKAKESIQDLEACNGSESLSHIVGLLEKAPLEVLQMLSGKDENELVKLGDNIDEYIQFLIDNPRDLMGIGSDFDVYDYSIGGGFRRKTINVIGARPKTGKTWLADKFGLNISSRQIPVLNLDTEMSKQDHDIRLLSMLSGVKIFDIESGRFARDKISKQKLFKAKELYKNIPYYFQSIAGRPVEDTLTLVKKWLITKVGYTNGVMNDCLVIYDYLKLMSSDSLNNLAEYQALGFMMTQLHNFAHKNDIPILAFVQLNRDGIDRESTDVVSQSDRINWLCSNMTIFKKKTKEEIMEDGVENGNRKLVPMIARHGEGLADGDYINVFTDFSRGKITEGSTKFQLAQAPKQNTFEDLEDVPFEV